MLRLGSILTDARDIPGSCMDAVGSGSRIAADNPRAAVLILRHLRGVAPIGWPASFSGHFARVILLVDIVLLPYIAGAILYLDLPIPCSPLISALKTWITSFRDLIPEEARWDMAKDSISLLRIVFAGVALCIAVTMAMMSTLWVRNGQWQWSSMTMTMSSFGSSSGSSSSLGTECDTPHAKVRFLSHDPFIAHIEDFMSARETGHLLELA